MERLETTIQLLKIAMMGLFLLFLGWLMATGGVPVRVVG